MLIVIHVLVAASVFAIFFGTLSINFGNGDA